MHSFNLIDEPWIPVRTVDGELATLSLQETLLRAGEQWWIEDGSPLTTAALYRFLLAVLHRALEGPLIVDDAARWFREGFPSGSIETYLNRWHDRFDLFHETRPFFQVPGLEAAAKPKPWTILLPEEGSNNTSVVFNPSLRAEYTPPSARPAEIARALLTYQTFALGGLIKVFLTSAPGAALAQAAVVVVLGDTINETLCLNLVPHRDIQHDTPLWEQEDVLTLENMRATPRRKALGFVQGYTWPNRSVLFIPETRGSETVVKHVLLGAGVRLAEGEAYRTDPMAAYRHTEKWGLLPVGFRADREFWRDFSALLPRETGKGEIAPAVVSHARDVYRTLRLSRAPKVFIAGLSNKRAKIEHWRAELFDLPSALLTDRDVYGPIAAALEAAEESGRILAKALSHLARHLLAQGERQPASTDVADLVRTFPGLGSYWSALQAEFAGLLSSLEPGFDSDAVAIRWEECIYIALREAWQSTISAVGNDASALRAIAQAERRFSPYMAGLYSRIHPNQETV